MLDMACLALSVAGKKGGRPILFQRGGDQGLPTVLRAYAGVVSPARPSRTVAVEPSRPLCDPLRSGRVVAPRDQLKRSVALWEDSVCGPFVGGVAAPGATAPAP